MPEYTNPKKPNSPSKGSVWKHFKGGQYVVEDLIWDTERNEWCVLHSRVNIEIGPKLEPLLNEALFSRPLSMWYDDIPNPCLVGIEGYRKRFTFLGFDS